jgi:hypothetical protein
MQHYYIVHLVGYFRYCIEWNCLVGPLVSYLLRIYPTEENHVKPKLVYEVEGLKYEPGTCCRRSAMLITANESETRHVGAS